MICEKPIVLVNIGHRRNEVVIISTSIFLLFIHFFR